MIFIDGRGTAMTLGYWGVGDVLSQSLSGVQPYQMECKTHVEVSCIPVNLYDRSLDEVFRHFQQTQAFFCIVRSESIRDRCNCWFGWDKSLVAKLNREC